MLEEAPGKQTKGDILTSLPVFLTVLSSKSPGFRQKKPVLRPFFPVIVGLLIIMIVRIVIRADLRAHHNEIFFSSFSPPIFFSFYSICI